MFVSFNYENLVIFIIVIMVVLYFDKFMNGINKFCDICRYFVGF